MSPFSDPPAFSTPEGSLQPSPTVISPGPKPWSGAAIAAFVLSLLGCLGFTAILGIIFSVVGILATRGGRRRGRVMAVAAIPLSVITGAIGLFLVAMLALVGQSMTATQRVGSLLRSGSGVEVSSPGGFLELCSEDLRQTLAAEEFASWLGVLQSKHGSFVEIAETPAPDPTSRGGDLRFTVQAKFVNGPATIRLTFRREGWWRWVVSDIEIDGASPRGQPDLDAPE